MLWHFYRDLLRLRREVPSLARLDKGAVEATSFTDQKALLVKRWNASSQVLIVSHFDPSPTELMLPVPPGRWHKTLDSEEERWGGKGSQIPAVLESHGRVQLSLGPWVFLVFVQITEISD
jgi:maltooligosyltrehalose trehalohydrolase